MAKETMPTKAQEYEALIDAVEAASASQGVDLYTGAARLKRWIDERYPMLEASLSREALFAYLTSCDADDDARNRELLPLLIAAPALLKQFVQQTIVDTAANLPAAPGGRPAVLTYERKREIVDAVGRLNLQGLRIGLCQTRAALRFGVSKRTVQRVWGRRAELEASPYQSLEDVFRFFIKQSP